MVTNVEKFDKFCQILANYVGVGEEDTEKKKMYTGRGKPHISS